MTTINKEQLDHVANLIQEAKQKIAEAARYAADHKLITEINLFGEEFYLENLDDHLRDYDLEDESEKRWYEHRKEELKETFGVSEGYVWATSSAFC
jgi:hypothetical protein